MIEIFGVKILDHIKVVFTNANLGINSYSRENEDFKLNEADLVEDLQNEFLNDFGYTICKDQVTFIENAVFFTEQGRYEREVKDKYFEKAKEDIKSYTLKCKAFYLTQYEDLTAFNSYVKIGFND